MHDRRNEGVEQFGRSVPQVLKKPEEVEQHGWALFYHPFETEMDERFKLLLTAQMVDVAPYALGIFSVRR
jgi:hypothetical protein